MNLDPKVQDHIENVLTKKGKPEDDRLLLDVWDTWLKETADIPKLLNSHIISRRPLVFKEPDAVSACIYDSFAGRIPVIVIGNDDDFEHFLINALHKGEWTDEIKKQGASFVFGKKNRFIVLSKKPYSNVPASDVGLSEEEWREKSMILRREHECTHYYTRRYYGSARQNLHDELIADFFGIYEAFGRYEARFFSEFIRKRITIYTADMTDTERQQLLGIADKCAAFLEDWSKGTVFKGLSRPERVDYLCGIGIQGMAFDPASLR